MLVRCNFNVGNHVQSRTFKTTEDFFEAILGPPQHDYHVKDYRRHQFRVEYHKRADEGDQRLIKLHEEFVQRHRAGRIS